MRKLLLAVPLLLVALLLQLTVLNGLQLPGGGVPDLVLVMVACLALAVGPVPGMVIGFVAGLAVDLAPPGSPVIGQYTLVFCLVGWACGRLWLTASRSAVRAVASLVVVIAAAEIFLAGLARALDQVTVSHARHVLPYSIVYDLLICPFVLYLVLLACSWVDGGLVAGQEAGGLLPGPARLAARRAAKKAQKPAPLQPQLRRAAARHHDAWLSATPRPVSGIRHLSAPHGARLRPGRGVAGSASGYAYHSAGSGSAGLAATPVRLKLTGGRRGDGLVGSAPGAPRLAGRHPGLLTGAGGSRAFRPHGGLPGGSAATVYTASPVPLRRPAAPKFSNYRGEGGLARYVNGNGSRRPTAVPRLRFGSARSPAVMPARSAPVPRLRFGGARSLAVSPARQTSVPRLRFGGARSLAVSPARSTAVPRLRFGGARSLAVSPARSTAVPRLRFGASKSALISPSRPAPAPRVDFRSHQRTPSRYRPAEPRFRAHAPAPRTSALAAGAMNGGSLDQQVFRAIRRNAASPRLRLASRRYSTGMLGGTGRGPTAGAGGHRQAVPHFRAHSSARRGSGPGRKAPKFGYGRRSVFKFLAAKHIGGRWLASRRAGSRSEVWIISRRPGGLG
jgi:rod shape-determining protein MreD